MFLFLNWGNESDFYATFFSLRWCFNCSEFFLLDEGVFSDFVFSFHLRTCLKNLPTCSLAEKFSFEFLVNLKSLNGRQPQSASSEERRKTQEIIFDTLVLTQNTVPIALDYLFRNVFWSYFYDPPRVFRSALISNFYLKSIFF